MSYKDKVLINAFYIANRFLNGANLLISCTRNTKYDKLCFSLANERNAKYDKLYFCARN